MPTGLHSVQKLSVTAPAALPAGCSTPSTQASPNSSLPNAAGHCVVNQHLPQQLQEQQTVTQPLRSVHHAGQSDAAAALLQTVVREAAADAGGPTTVGFHLADEAQGGNCIVSRSDHLSYVQLHTGGNCDEAQGGNTRSRQAHVESSLVTGSVITEEEFEVGAHVTWFLSPSNIMQRAIRIRLLYANAMSCHMFIDRKCCLGKQWLCMVCTTF